ncbi:hypothetical protein CHS0354_013620 [Potamilus streckersoni]|uniref:NACHT domain-containing protein n=1 Tax=Potamilus streckersoni TaxID=2493646 RepID=A0AAE0SLQ5_9BIVA|nr:hypothetical protein CHS0354_013620 [Potamilus streckersoni]
MALVSVEVYQQHKSLMIKLSDMMDPKDHTYQNFIYYLESYIPKGRLSTIQQNPTVVFSVMEETRDLEVGKYENLEKALEASGYMNILDVLKEEGENITKQLRKRDYSDGSIAGSSSYIDAATVSSIEPEERHNKKLRKLEKDIQEIKASISQGTDQVSAVKIESDISKLRDDLIKAYRNLRCVQVSPLFEKRRCNIDNIFVDLVIEAKHDRRNADGSKYGSTQRNNDQSGHKKTIEVTSYKQIFLDERCLKLFKRVYLRGKGGLGKTTFCRKVLHAWCNAHEGRPVSQDGFFQDEAILKLFDILFYLNLREVSVKTNLIEAICDQFPLEEVPSKDVLGNLLKINGDKVLFILDGLDEMVVIPRCIENVLTRRVYPKCCFLVSSRPWKMSQMELHEEMEIDLLLDLQGFSKQNAIKFAENIFNNCYNDGSAIREFEMDLYSNKLATQLFHVPLILLFMAQVWYENERSLPNKLHKLYILLLNLLTDRMMEKYKKDPTQKQTRFVSGFMQSSLPTKLSETSLVVNFGEEFLLSLCEVAYHFLLKGEMESSLVFEETNLLKAFGNRGKEKLDVALDLSILSVTDSISYLHRRTSVSFLHKTMQEFFTAVYFILSSEKLADFISSMTDLNAVKQNENSIVFLVGLMPELGNRVLEKVNELCKDDWERSNERLKMYRYGFHDISIIYLRCKEEVIGDEVQLNVFGLDLQQNYFNPQYWNPDFLQYLKITGFSNSSIVNYVLLDLKGLRKLKYLELSKLECDLYLPMSDSLSSLIMSNTTLSNSCCDVLGSSLQHYSKLKNLQICGTNLRNCLLDFSNMKELEDLYMLYVTLSSSCSDVLGRTLIHCTKLIVLSIHNTNLHNCLLDVSNMTELRVLDISKVILSCSCCEVLGTSLKHCPKLQILSITKTNLHNCLLDLSNMTELTALYMLKVILSSTCCNVLGSTMKHQK